MENERMHEGTTSRRGFLKAGAGASMAALLANAYHAHAAGSDTIRVGLVGCGRRGIGAAKDCVTAAEGVEIVALADVFEDKLAEATTELAKLGDKFKATADTSFTGFDAFKKLMAADINYVILATPPGFHPEQLRAAIEAGKHVFMEKPAAVDPVGVRSIIETAKMADEKKLSIVAGTQRRHQTDYIETMTRVRDGAIGDLVAAQCYWIGDYDYYTGVPHKPEWSDMEWQLRNWNYFTWLSGDHIVEQHVHNIDIIHWAMRGKTPVKAIGLGGRQQRTGPEYGHIYDHFSVEFEYADGTRVQSLCRQMKGLSNRVGENLVGTKGTSNARDEIKGENPYKHDVDVPNPYVREHADLIKAIRANEPINEGVTVAESTMLAILGRLAAYSGREISWKWVMEGSKLDLRPDRYELGPLPVPPVPIPGEYELV